MACPAPFSSAAKLLRMRFRLRSLLAIVLLFGLGLGWWRDRAQVAMRLDLRERQVRLLQMKMSRRPNLVAASNPHLATSDTLIGFVETASDDEFRKQNWGQFASSEIADQSVVSLANLLGSRSEATRRHAVWLLGQVGRKRRPPTINPVPSLICALYDPSSRVRAEAIYALGGYGRLAREALPHLEKLANCEQAEDALWATRAVKEIDASIDIGPRLRELLLCGKPGVRRTVALLLPDHLPFAEAQEMLLEEYEKETDDATRDVLAQAMNKISE